MLFRGLFIPAVHIYAKYVKKRDEILISSHTHAIITEAKPFVRLCSRRTKSIYLEGKQTMSKFFKRKYSWAAVFSAVLTLFTVFVLLDTFVISKAGDLDGTKSDNADIYDPQTIQKPTGTFTENSYEDENISVTLTQKRKYETEIYIADIKIKDVSYLKTAFAKNTYGRNITSKTSDMAEENNAIIAINGDYYGFRDYGYVVRNGVYYRGVKSQEKDAETLAIFEDGTFKIFSDTNISCDEIYADGAVQVFSFGPGLINNGEINVVEGEEVGKALASNPRTAIGMLNDEDGMLHYVFVVSDGRTDESKGLSLYQLAQVMDEIGCEYAYNLDGGGSATMWFNGRVVNVTTDGKSFRERKVSDIVYIGY